MGSVFQRQQTASNELCKGGHKWGGRLPTIHDNHLKDTACDCGKFTLGFEGCGCDGTKKIALKENPNFN